jgi:isoquinoline 1-oxidoreductase alpha subunit
MDVVLVLAVPAPFFLRAKRCAVAPYQFQPLKEKIETIESLEKSGQLSKVQKAWVGNHVPQCGYCQSGMVMATTALLRNNPKPTDAQIDESITNICRCGTFQQVRAAIHAAAKA